MTANPPQTEPLLQPAKPSLTAEGCRPGDGASEADQSVTPDEGKGRQPMFPRLPHQEPCNPNQTIIQGPDTPTRP